MIDVYFSVSDYMSDQKYPKCDHAELSDTYDSVKLPVGDPKIKEYKDRGYYDHGIIHSSVHYFDEVGFLKCRICGWKP